MENGTLNIANQKRSAAGGLFFACAIHLKADRLSPNPIFLPGGNFFSSFTGAKQHSNTPILQPVPPKLRFGMTKADTPSLHPAAIGNFGLKDHVFNIRVNPHQKIPPLAEILPARYALAGSKI